LNVEPSELNTNIQYTHDVNATAHKSLCGYKITNNSQETSHNIEKNPNFRVETVIGKAFSFVFKLPFAGDYRRLRPNLSG